MQLGLVLRFPFEPGSKAKQNQVQNQDLQIHLAKSFRPGRFWLNFAWSNFPGLRNFVHQIVQVWKNLVRFRLAKCSRPGRFCFAKSSKPGHFAGKISRPGKNSCGQIFQAWKISLSQIFQTWKMHFHFAQLNLPSLEDLEGLTLQNFPGRNISLGQIFRAWKISLEIFQACKISLKQIFQAWKILVRFRLAKFSRPRRFRFAKFSKPGNFVAEFSRVERFRVAKLSSLGRFRLFKSSRSGKYPPGLEDIFQAWKISIS